MKQSPPISEASEYSIRNRDGLVEGTKAACYHCMQVFSAKEVTDFTDAGETALCPYCGIDSVLPEHAGFAFTPENLESLRAFWFGSNQAPNLW